MIVSRTAAALLTAVAAGAILGHALQARDLTPEPATVSHVAVSHHAAARPVTDARHPNHPATRDAARIAYFTFFTPDDSCLADFEQSYRGTRRAPRHWDGPTLTDGSAVLLAPYAGACDND